MRKYLINCTLCRYQTDSEELFEEHIQQDHVRKEVKAKMDGLIEGRTVHYVMPDGVAHRAAMLTQVFPQPGSDNPLVNMTVFPDILNDYKFGVIWCNVVAVGKGSVKYSEGKEANTWHWPERI